MTWFVRGGASRDAYDGPGVTYVGRAHCGAVCLTVCLSPLSLLPLIHLFLYQGGQSSPPLTPALDVEEGRVGEMVGCGNSWGMPRAQALPGC